MQVTVRTENSTYLLDCEAMTATRVVRDLSGRLRRDGEPLTLLAWPDVQVGLPLEMLLRVREDGTPTLRSTSLVERVLLSA